MLPIGFIGSVLYDFAKKRTKQEKHLFRNFLLCNMVFFLLFGLVVGASMVGQQTMYPTGRNSVAIGPFLILVACLFLLIGLAHGVFWWQFFREEEK